MEHLILLDEVGRRCCSHMLSPGLFRVLYLSTPFFYGKDWQCCQSLPESVQHRKMMHMGPAETSSSLLLQGGGQCAASSLYSITPTHSMWWVCGNISIGWTLTSFFPSSLNIFTSLANVAGLHEV